MTDVVDRASQLEQMQRDSAIKNNKQHEKPLIINGVRHCLACDDIILSERIKAVNAVRCINCQQLHEHQQKHYRQTGRQC